MDLMSKAVSEKVKQAISDNWKMTMTIISLIIVLIVNIAMVSARFSNVQTRLEATEKAIETKQDKELNGYQYSEIIRRLEKIDGKIDKLESKD